MQFWTWILIGWASLLLASTAGAVEQKRYALVIGNAAYKSAPLANPVNDATDIAKSLKDKGFKVTRLLNATKRDMEQAISQFTRKLSHENSLGLFYFAGHGLELDGDNWLVPVGANINSEVDVKYDSVNAGRVVYGMQQANNGLNLVILDACRDNPYKRGWRSASRGLADMNPAEGIKILYATQPGNVASDGTGRNGVFTEHFLKVIEQPGIELNEAIKKIAAAVRKDTGRRQVPWAEGIIIGNFYFILRPVPEPVSVPAADPELMFWSSVNQCGSAACYREYLKTYPRGRFAGLAKVQLQRLKPAEPELIPFTVKTTPEGGRVRILNIGPKYRDGIELKPGRYRLEATRHGYRKHLGWHELTTANPVYVAELEEIPPKPPKPVYSDPTASRPQSARPSSGSAQAGQTWRDPVTGMEFVYVPKGCYRMGSKVYGDVDEKPVHQVCVDGYWLGKYEVTQGQWEKVMGGNPSDFKKGESHPVEQVSWNDVQDYIRKLNNKGGAQFRLPTEAEWEYACRSGGKNEKFSGGNSPDRVAWYWYGDNSEHTTHRVGTKAANGLGLHDMSGNVWEWVQDVYDFDAYSGHASNNPVNTGGGDYRVVRGGGWSSSGYGWNISSASSTRCANRINGYPGVRRGYLGFRLLRK